MLRGIQCWAPNARKAIKVYLPCKGTHDRWQISFRSGNNTRRKALQQSFWYDVMELNRKRWHFQDESGQFLAVHCAEGVMKVVGVLFFAISLIMHCTSSLSRVRVIESSCTVVWWRS